MGVPGMAGLADQRQGGFTVNAETKAVARELVAWFTSGNSVPVDVRQTAKVNGDRIMADASRLKAALVDDDGSA